MLISIRVTAFGFGLRARPGRPDQPRPTHFDPLGRSESLAESVESPRVAPSRSTEPLRTTKIDRKGRPRRSEMRFSTISGRFSGRFSRSFEVASRERLDSQREGPNLCFCRQAQHFQGFADFAEKPKIDENRQKIAPTMLRERTARRKLDFSVPGRDLVSIFVSSACSQALQGALSGVPGHPWRPSGRSRGAPGTLRDAPETLPRRLRDALRRHGVSGEGPGTDFQSILGAPRCLWGSIFGRFSR